MKHSRLATTFLLAAAFAVGCKPTAEQSTAEDREATTPRFDEVKKDQP